MGVDYRAQSGNPFWDEMGRKHPKQLVIIPFSSNKETVNFYWNNIGANSITGIYEPFGYTMCETLDRRAPAIVQNIGGPAEIDESVKNSIIEYEVDIDFEKDKDNFLKALNVFWDTSADDRQSMAENARTALDRFRPEVIKEAWKKILIETKPRSVQQLNPSHTIDSTGESTYGN